MTEKELKIQIKDLKAALKIYADEENWNGCLCQKKKHGCNGHHYELFWSGPTEHQDDPEFYAKEVLDKYKDD